MSTSQKTYTVSLIGAAGVGKTSMLKRINGKDFDCGPYVPTGGATAVSFEVDGVRFNVWDCAGQDVLGNFDKYYGISDCAIVMFDDRKLSIARAKEWASKFRRVRPNAPIELVANKCDVKSRKPRADVTNSSVKNNENVTEIFRNLIAKLN